MSRSINGTQVEYQIIDDNIHVLFDVTVENDILLNVEARFDNQKMDIVKWIVNNDGFTEDIEIDLWEG